MEEIKSCPVCNSARLTNYIKTKDFTITKEEFQIRKCEECNLLITTPRPAQKDLGSYYISSDYISHSKKANSLFDKLYHLARLFTLKSKTKLLNHYSTNKTILDFGCGTGTLITHLKQKGWTVNGVEPSNSARAIASEQLSKDEIQSGIETITRRFQLITLWHVLEHIPDLRETLHKFKAYLEKDGLIFIAVPNSKSWESNIYGDFWAAYDTPRHLWHFNRKAMEILSQNAGYKLVKILPMKLDSFYISMLSEKYKNNGAVNPLAFIKGFINGLRSNIKARKTGEYSSLIYILKNEENQ